MYIPNHLENWAKFARGCSLPSGRFEINPTNLSIIEKLEAGNRFIMFKKTEKEKGLGYTSTILNWLFYKASLSMIKNNQDYKVAIILPNIRQVDFVEYNMRVLVSSVIPPENYNFTHHPQTIVLFDKQYKAQAIFKFLTYKSAAIDLLRGSNYDVVFMDNFRKEITWKWVLFKMPTLKMLL